MTIRIMPLIIVLCLSPSLVAAQGTSSDGGILTKSMGFPPVWKPYMGVMAVWDRKGESNRWGGSLNFGVYKDLGHPVAGLLGVGLEAYGTGVQGDTDSGVRALVGSRSFMMHVGLDYSFINKSTMFLASLSFPLWRAGPFRNGGDVRIDWIPGKNQSFQLGLNIPVWQPKMGRTRPIDDHVVFPEGSKQDKPDFEPGEELRKVLADIGEAAVWINHFTTPFLDQEIRSQEDALGEIDRHVREFEEYIGRRDEDFPKGHTYEAVTDFYHDQIDRAFSLALDDGAGGISDLAYQTAAVARAAFLEEVIIPYNRLLGQRKENDTLLGLGGRAEQVFRTWLYLDSDIPREKREAVIYVLRSLLDCMEAGREASRDKWGESRLVWIPMHYALRFEDHDTQGEMDALIEKAVGTRFTTGNDVHYIINEQFQIELARMILKAEDYHVLWIHDYSGVNGAGDPDKIGYRMTVEAYLRALIERVKAYDATGKIPIYMIFLDQYYFETNGGKLWLEFLEDPLTRTVDLPEDFEEWEEVLSKAQQELRQAVEESKTLQAGLARYGEEWLHNKVKVHINITNPADFSFRSAHLADYLPFATDNIMRDHRKIGFYDVTELDPGRGEAIYTGMGIGEHYVGPAWDDRAVLVRGPVLVDLKRTVRELLYTQGFKRSEIPSVLLPEDKPYDYDEMVADLVARGWKTSAMQVHNLTGYYQKDANVVRALLYDLMPPGSHLYIPDSLWNSPFWGAMLAGASMRGCWVFVIAPSLANAPSAGAPQMSRANELFSRFVAIQEGMRETIEEAGGMFRVGIYDLDIDIQDQVARGELIQRNLAENEWLLDVFPFHPSVFEMLAGLKEEFEARGYKPAHLAGEETGEHKPKLHLKSQLFVSGQAMSTMLPLEGWKDLIRDYVLARAEEISLRGPDGRYPDVKDRRRKLSESAGPLVEAWEASLTPEQRDQAIFYLTVGSLNQNYRGKIMDGEVLFVVSDIDAMMAFLDFAGMMHMVTWVESIEELEELLPSYGGLLHWLGRYMKRAL